MSLDNTFGSFLEKRRTQLGKSRAQIAKDSGAHPVEIWRWEKGKRKPSRIRWAKIAEAYAMSETDLREAMNRNKFDLVDSALMASVTLSNLNILPFVKAFASSKHEELTMKDFLKLVMLQEKLSSLMPHEYMVEVANKIKEEPSQSSL